MRVLSLALLLAAGCGSGCDGDRAKPPEMPRPPIVAPGDGGVGSGAVEVLADGGVAEPPIGFLDAPRGTMEYLYKALAGAENKEPTARVLMVFFGDSHTAGDSMTSRIRTTWQPKFGDGGRGLVAAGRPPARHYYQRDVRYGASGVWKSAVGGVRDPEPYGIAGLRVYGERKGSLLWVETCIECKAGNAVSQFEILYHASPTSG